MKANTKATELDRFVNRLGSLYAKELLTDSAIDPEVAMERGYLPLLRPKGEGNYDNSPMPGSDSRAFLRAAGFPSWSFREDYYFPGLWIPGWDARGTRFAGQWKPARPVNNREGKPMKYAGAEGSPARLDVHPRWTRDPDPDGRSNQPPAIRDITVPLWITEGVKKADSLTSRGVCTIALSGVYNWRNSLATLGDWEDVPRKGREVTICFDADAITKPAVAQAMERLGRWLRSGGAGKIWYCVVPGEVVTDAGVTPVKGVDDYFAAGGTLKALEQARTDRPPAVRDTDDTYTDARLAETVAAEVLDGAYIHVPSTEKSGTGQWYGWNGKRWAQCSDIVVTESVRRWALDRFAQAAADLADHKNGAAGAVDGLRPLLSAARLRSVLSLARGVDYVVRQIHELDADPDLLNTPSGVVHLPTKELRPHSPDYLMTKITGVAYNPNADMGPWLAAMAGCMPHDALNWLQVYIGNAATGHPTPDGRTLFMTGPGNAGKTMIAGAIFTALGGHVVGGGYAVKVPNTLLLKSGAGAKGQATPEKMTLLGCRYAYIEETPEGGHLDANTLKEIQDAKALDGRALYKGTVQFPPSHSMSVNTNHPPIVSDTDNGTWRRLARVKFPYRFVPEGKPLIDENDRRADPRIKASMSRPEALEACLRWIVEGAHMYYQADQIIPPDPESVRAAVHEWRMESDLLLRYLSDRCEFDPDSCVSSSVLHADFIAWYKAAGHSAPYPQRLFTTRLKDHSGLPGAITLRTGVRFATVNVSMPPATAGSWMVGAPALPNQGAAWFGLRFRAEPDA